ncbi:MAG: imelysin [Bacteroidales bacterium]|nr:imelysin [Bacteroidales bacterium]
MKKIKFLSMIALFGAMTLFGFASCNDDDNDDVLQEQDAAMEALTKQYVNNVVYNTYTALAGEAQTLYQQINTLKAKLKAGTAVAQSEIDAICVTYKLARKHWEESEAFLFGPAADFEIDPHIDTWPLDVATLAKDLSDDAKIAELDKEDGIDYARENLTAENLGFHGIEFIFFRNGANRNVAIFNNDAVEDYAYKGTQYFAGMTVTGKEEVIFASAVAGDLRDKCYQLLVSWKGSGASTAAQSRIAELFAKDAEEWQHTVKANGLSFGANMLAATTQVSTYASWRKVMEEIFDGCIDICGEVGDQKMGQAYRAATSTVPTYHEGEDGGQEQDDPNYIESPYSHNSFTDFYGNIQSIKNSLYGDRDLSTPSATSLMAYLQQYNKGMADELENEMKDALNALTACLNSGVAFVDAPGAALVGKAIEEVGELADKLAEAKRWVLMN